MKKATAKCTEKGACACSKKAGSWKVEMYCNWRCRSAKITACILWQSIVYSCIILYDIVYSCMVLYIVVYIVEYYCIVLYFLVFFVSYCILLHVFVCVF